MTNDPDSSPAEALYLRLEVTPDASQQQIASAYRRLVRGAHPDARPGDPEAAQRFREITEAYDVLSDPLRRARYDRSRGLERLDLTRLTNTAERPSDKTRDPARRRGPITLGIDLPPMRSSAVPLWAGPVRVEPASKPTTPPYSLDRPFSEIASLLSEIVELWWRF